MTHYVAIVEEEEGKAVGVWFPDLPGCFSAGDTLDEAMLNAREAIALYADALREDGQPMPRARTLTELKADADAAADIETYLIALIPFGPAALRPAAVLARRVRPGLGRGIHDVRAERRGAGAAGLSRIWAV